MSLPFQIREYKFRHFKNGHFTNEYYAIKPTDVVHDCLLGALESQRDRVHEQMRNFRTKKSKLAHLKKERVEVKDQINALLSHPRSDNEVINQVFNTKIKDLNKQLDTINNALAGEKQFSSSLKKTRKNLNKEIKVHNTIVDEFAQGRPPVGKIDLIG